MERLQNGFTLNIPQGCFPLSTDSMLLAGFARIPRNASVLDIGSGCGTVGMLLCARHPLCTVTGVELDQAAHLAALENARANQLTHRLTSICAPWEHIPQLLPPGSFHCCVSNPPYYPNEPESQRLHTARQGIGSTADTLFASAAWALRYGGDLFLVHKPEYLAQLCAGAVQAGLEPKRLCLIRHRADLPVTLILLQCRKGGKPGLVWQEEALFLPDDRPTAFYRDIYHLVNP